MSKEGTELQFVNWNSGEPNDYGNGEDCGILASWYNGKWNDVPCDWVYQGICEAVCKTGGVFTDDQLYEIRKSFCSLETMALKQQALQDNRVSAALAEALLTPTEHCDIDPDLLTDDIEDKVKENCGLDCENDQKEAIKKVEEVENGIEKVFNDQIKKAEEGKDNIDKLIEVFGNIKEEIEKIPNETEEEKKARIKGQRDKALTELESKKKVLPELEYNHMKRKIENANDDDVERVIEDTEKELTKQKNLYEKKGSEIESRKEKAKEVFKKTKKGIKSMSTAENLGKAANAATSFKSAYDKFSKKEDCGENKDCKKRDVMNKISGALDIASGLAEFAPPPASIVTGAVSQIFGMFMPSEPSTNDIIKEGFAEQKILIKNQFKEQKAFIETEFEEQTEELKEAINEALDKKSLRDVQINAKALEFYFKQSEMILESAASASQLSERIIDSLTSGADVLSNTDEVFAIQEFISHFCKPILGQKRLPKAAKYCMVVITAFIEMDQQRSIIMTSIINLLLQSELPLAKTKAGGYAKVETLWKQNRKNWVQKLTKITPAKATDTSIRLSCRLTNSKYNIWSQNNFYQEFEFYAKWADNEFEPESTSLCDFLIGKNLNFTLPISFYMTIIFDFRLLLHNGD